MEPSFPLESEVLVNSHYKACIKLLDKGSPLMGLRRIANDPFGVIMKVLVLPS